MPDRCSPTARLQPWPDARRPVAALLLFYSEGKDGIRGSASMEVSRQTRRLGGGSLTAMTSLHNCNHVSGHGVHLLDHTFLSSWPDRLFFFFDGPAGWLAGLFCLFEFVAG